METPNSMRGTKIATRSSLTLQCLSCGTPDSIAPQRTLRGFMLKFNRFKRAHRICSVRMNIQAKRRRAQLRRIK